MSQAQEAADAEEAEECQGDIFTALGRLNVGAARHILRTVPGAVTKKDGRGETALHGAALDGHMELCQLLLAARADVDAKGNDSWTPLHFAAVNGNADAVTLLLEAKALVTAKDNDGFTPLHGAALKGHAGVVTLLLEAKALVTAQNKYGQTPLDGARQGHAEVARLLEGVAAAKAAKPHEGYQVAPPSSVPQAATGDADPTKSPEAQEAADAEEARKCKGDIVEAAKCLNVGAVRHFLRTVPGAATKKDDEGFTALQGAALHGHMELCQLLLAARADVEAKTNPLDWNPLHGAAHCGHADVVTLLLEAKALVTAKDVDGRSPLHIAANNGRADVVTLLLEAKASVTAKDKYGKTPLDRARQKGHAEVARLLEGAVYEAAAKAAKPNGGYQVQPLLQKEVLGQVPQAALPTFASSNFKELYNECNLGEDYGIWGFVEHFSAWLKDQGLADVATEVTKKLEKKSQDFYREEFKMEEKIHKMKYDEEKEEEAEILEAKLEKEKQSRVSKLATFAWTLTDKVYGRELCSYMNEIVREDDKDRLKPLLPLARAINKVLVTRGHAANDWPAENISYRGSGIPREQLKFFEENQEYRCPMYLATSFDRKIAMQFASRNANTEKDMAIFHVHYDENRGCKHVNYLKSVSAVPSEAEFLFPPYSAFKVRSPPREDKGSWVIEIDAFPDNADASEDLPLAFWH